MSDLRNIPRRCGETGSRYFPFRLVYLVISCVSSKSMLDYDIQRCTRRCAATDRELQPDEPFYSVLVAEGAEIVRRDYCEAAWQAPPEDAVGWWKSRMPSAGGNKVHWAPNDVMLHYLEQLANDPAQSEMVYVLALLLTRRRVLRLDGSETGDNGCEVLLLSCPRHENEYRIPVASPDPERISEIQDQLARLLFSDGPEVPQSPTCDDSAELPVTEHESPPNPLESEPEDKIESDGTSA